MINLRSYLLRKVFYIQLSRTKISLSFKQDVLDVLRRCADIGHCAYSGEEPCDEKVLGSERKGWLMVATRWQD